MNLKDKMIIITGVSRGIGLATAKVLLEKDAIVIGWSRTSPTLNHKNFYHFYTDVSDINSVQNSYLETTNELGKNIDILINNAGIGYESPIEEMIIEQWQQMFETNVHSIFYCSKFVIPHMKHRERGHIINISSIAGTTGIPKMAGYCGTKHAVRGISHAMYKELRNYGIKVTCIYPGSVKTNFFDKIDSIEANDHMMLPDDIAGSVIHILESSPNYHHVDMEVRPLKPKG